VAFPSINAEVDFWDDGGSIITPGTIEALSGTVADIRIDPERLEEGVELETGSYHPYRGYRQHIS
jgi:hypothetical protein